MTILLLFLAGLLFLSAFMLIRAFQVSRYPEPVSPVEKINIDPALVSRHISELIQIKSISTETGRDAHQAAFERIHAWIETTFPGLSAKLDKTTINAHSLLLAWRGSDPNLVPVLFNAHLDVVPVEESTLVDWQVPPFEGVIDKDFVWGRGAIDMKAQVAGLLNAVEQLLTQGYSPKRTIYLAFGHDEEIMGLEGSRRIMEYLKSQGVKLAALLDEGGMITQGAISEIEEPFAMIGVAEKGYLTIKLNSSATPGHSSQPPRQTAIGILARAIALLDDNPMPARLEFLLPTLARIGHLLPFMLKIVTTNSWLFGGILKKKLQSSPRMNAMIRSTHAATIIRSGVKDNVLPAVAEAKLNFRLLPGDSVENVLTHVRKVIADPRVQVSVDEANGGWEASRVSPTDTPAYLSLELIARQIFNNVSVAPFLFLAATDSRHYQPICTQIYRFSPIVLSSGDLGSMHGTNERVRKKSISDMVAFYARVMRVWGEAGF